LRPGDAVFIPNPFSHIMGMVMGVIMPLVAGATLVTTPSFQAAETLSLVERFRCVAMAGTPAHYLALVTSPDLARRDHSSLRFGMCGGAAQSPEMIRRIVGELHLEGLMNGLGMTEASGSITRTRLDAPAEITASTIGHPMPWLEMRVVDPSSGAAVSPGEHGELAIRGPGVMKGYFRAPEATREALSEDGWLRTGDLVRARPNGALEFVGRIKEMFTVGGFNVYPAEVERALAEHPSVAESCVVGVRDERLGEVPYAFVVLRAAAPSTEDALVAFLRDRAANYKVPRYVSILSELPMLGSGKVDRLALRDRAARDPRVYLPR
jgi:acyl-CoA synthetase (AMP-forming)/AMP-acid ligase II